LWELKPGSECPAKSDYEVEEAGGEWHALYVLSLVLIEKPDLLRAFEQRWVKNISLAAKGSENPPVSCFIFSRFPRKKTSLLQRPISWRISVRSLSEGQSQ